MGGAKSVSPKEDGETEKDGDADEEMSEGEEARVIRVTEMPSKEVVERQRVPHSLEVML